MVPCVQEIESNGKLYVGIGKVVPAGGAGKGLFSHAVIGVGEIISQFAGQEAT